VYEGPTPKKFTANQRKEHNVGKHIQWVGYNSVAIFIRLAVVEPIAVQGHPRSSILVPIESAYATSISGKR